MDIDDLRHVAALEPVEQDDLVDAVEEFGAEVRPHHRHDLIAHRVAVLPLRLVGQIFGAEIRGHHDERVAEVDGVTLAIGEAAVVEHLQEHVEHVGVGLFDLVEQHHLVGSPSHCLGERAAFLVADIAGRCADQAGDRMFLHVFRHVHADQRVLVVEQVLGQRFGQFGLAHAGRPQEHERADRPVRILQACARAPHRG